MRHTLGVPFGRGDPGQLRPIFQAFEAAMSSAEQDERLYLGYDQLNIRERIADGILAAVSAGISDMEDLTTEGLRALDALCRG